MNLHRWQFVDGNDGTIFMALESKNDIRKDKPLIYDTLTDLIKEFSVSYELNGHELRKIKLGGAISNDICSQVRFLGPKGKCTVDLVESGRS